jgi:GNAT superfamily N-acetyltransferase
MMAPHIEIREAVPGDEGLVLTYVKKLAAFERLEDSVRATEEDFRRDLFERTRIHAAFAVDGAGERAKTVGFALWFYNYSTFRGRPGLFLEDLYVDEEYRGNGIARAFFRYLERRARDEGCTRLEWTVLSWNEKAKEFYRSTGGKHHEGWEIFRKEIGE